MSEKQDRRNELAQELGYRNAYDYRVHGNGTIPPDEPAATGWARAIMDGHISDLAVVAEMEEGDVERIHTIQTGDEEWDVIYYDGEGNRSYTHLYDLDDYEMLVEWAESRDVEMVGSIPAGGT